MTSLTIPPYNTDLDAWRARIEAKRERNHYFWRLEEKARESQRNPRKVKQVATEACDECGTHYVRRQDNQRFCSKKCRDRVFKRATRERGDGRPPIRPCVTCGRMTRPTYMRIEDHPDTVTRFQGDKCHSCYRIDGRSTRDCRHCAKPIPPDAYSHRTYCDDKCRKAYHRDHAVGVKPCAHCGKLTRPANTTVEEHPGTILRARDGLCNTCLRGAVAPESRARRCGGCDAIIPADANPRQVYCTTTCRRKAGHRRERSAAAGQEVAA